LRSRKALGTPSQRLEANESILTELGLPVSGIEQLMAKFHLSYNSERLSWHHHIFASWSLTVSGKSPGAVLEIGTESGAFANFLGAVLPMKEVYTIDLPDSDEKFISEYGRENENYRADYLARRSENVTSPNVHFKSMDSTFILAVFSELGNTSQPGVNHGIFDAVWVDGDHRNPQVTIDIVQSLALLKPEGFLLVDDVVMDPNFRSDKYVSNESWKTLIHLQKAVLVRCHFFNKRTRVDGLQKHLGFVQRIS